MKDRAFHDFINSGYEHYTDFVKEDLKGMKPVYHNRKQPLENTGR